MKQLGCRQRLIIRYLGNQDKPVDMKTVAAKTGLNFSEVKKCYYSLAQKGILENTKDLKLTDDGLVMFRLLTSVKVMKEDNGLA